MRKLQMVVRFRHLAQDDPDDAGAYKVVADSEIEKVFEFLCDQLRTSDAARKARSELHIRLTAEEI